MVVTSAEELLRRVSEGWRVYPDNRTGRWRIKRNNRFERIARELEDLARKIYVEQQKASKVREGEPGESGAVRAQGRGSAGTSEVLRALGEEYAAVVRSITEKTRWFADALTYIGWYSTLAAFQFAKVDPKDIPVKVAEFADVNNFVRFVTENLSAMIEANAEGAKAIMECKRELTRYRNALKVLAYIATVLRKQLRSVIVQLQLAHNIISKYGLLEEYLNLTSQYAVVEALMSIPPAQEGAGGEGKEAKGVRTE